jgi:hypothetical protein
LERAREEIKANLAALKRRMPEGSPAISELESVEKMMEDKRTSGDDSDDLLSCFFDGVFRVLSPLDS